MVIAYTVGRGLWAIGAAEIGKDARPHVDWSGDGEGLRVLQTVAKEFDVTFRTCIQQTISQQEDIQAISRRGNHVLPSMPAQCAVFHARASVVYAQCAQHEETLFRRQTAYRSAQKSIGLATQWANAWRDFEGNECLLLLGGPDGRTSSSVRSEWICNCKVHG